MTHPPPKRSRWWLWLLLAASPCFCLCGGSSLLGQRQREQVKELKASAAPIIATLETEHAATGKWPKAVPAVEHLTYELKPDGGFLLYFSDPPLLAMPTDFFNVYDPVTKDWVLKSDTELWPLSK